MESARLPGTPSTTPEWHALVGQLRRFIAARIASRSDVDDIVQLVLERALAARARREASRASTEDHRLDDEQVRNHAAWLIAIARNAIVDHYRVRRTEGIDEVASRDDAPVETEAADGRDSLLACMRPLLSELSLDAQMVLRWADMEDRAMSNIASALGLSVSGAKSRVQRARQELLHRLLHCCLIERDAVGRAVDLAPKSKGCTRCAVEPHETERYAP